MKTLSIRSRALVEGTRSEIARLKQGLQVRNTYQDYTLEAYEEGPRATQLYIPRALVAPKIPVDSAEWEPLNLESKITLRPAQKTTIKDFMEYLETSPRGAILASGTGTGKTVMGLQLIVNLGLKALVIVPTVRIFRQWVEAAKKFTSLRRVGVVQGPTCEIDSPITIAMLHTIRKPKYDHIINKFGTILFDEVHTISTKYFHTVASKFWCKTRIGLTATPRRKDGMQNVFFWHIGKIATRFERPLMKPKVIVVQYFNPSTSHSGCVWSGNLSIGKYYSRLVGNTDRNKLIAKYMRGAYNSGHDTLVLTARLAHVENLINLSRLPKQDCGRLTAKVKEIDRKMIVGTYGSAGLGLDIPRLSCLIMAVPQADVEQAVGRVLRAKDKPPVVIDIVDTASYIMKMWFHKRLKYYKKVASEIVPIGVG